MEPLSPGRWRRIQALLDAALDLPRDARGAFLADPAAGDADLCAEVRRLLSLEVRAERFLERPAAEFGASLLANDEAPALLADTGRGAGNPGETAAAFAGPLPAAAASGVGLEPGELIGPYRIEEELGRGGMGVVYRASRADGAFRKDVALKLVKRGMDTDEVLARFRRERQVLASLEHPGIARLMDGGVAVDGRPYLVMEFVEGEPITTYCDRRGLNLEERLALFERVCSAVQHAHRRLVVHRDLKPANILIIEGDAGVPQPKLLDFGIARLLDSDGGEELTRAGTRLLTPSYAAPEQVRCDVVTTAADVYALGVVLYELLVGRRPASEGISPSAAVSAEAAGARGITEDNLRRRLRGDVDAIVLTALRADPDDRYPSVESLLEDLRRRRSGLPVQARLASRSYRVGKFLRRHRPAVSAAAVGAGLLFGLGLFHTHGIDRQKRLAEQETRRAQLMSSVMQDLFATADPATLRGQKGDSLLLVRGRQLIRGELAAEPDLQAQLLTTLGRVYRQRGQYDLAVPVLEQALATAHALPEDTDGRAIAVLRELGGLHSEMGAYAAARQRYSQMVALQRARSGEHHADVLIGLNLLAQIEALAGRLEEAERMHRHLVASSQRVRPPTDTAHIHGIWKLARVLYMRGKYRESETALREVLRLRRQRLGNAHPQVAQALQWLGLVLTDAGDFNEAELYLQQALTMQRSTIGEEHDDVAVTLFGLGLLANERGSYDEAAEFVGQSVAMAYDILGEQHTTTAFRRQVLAEIHRGGGNFEAALTNADRAMAGYRATLGPSHPRAAAALAAKARVLSDAGRYEEAAEDFGKALAILGNASSPGSAYHQARAGYGQLLVRTGRPAEAEPILRDAVANLVGRSAADHDRWTVFAKTALADCLEAQELYGLAEPIREEILRINNDHYGPGHPATRAARRALRRSSHARADAGRCLRSHCTARRGPQSNHPATRNCTNA